MISIEQKEELNKKGFLFLKKFESDFDTQKIAKTFGEILDVENVRPDNRIKIVQTLKPKKYSDARKNTYSSIFGYEEFPLHSDYAHWITPPRYLILRCISGSSSVYTKLLHSSKLISNYGDLCRRAVVIARRKSNEEIMMPLPILFERNGEFGFRWDSFFLEKVNSASKELNEIILKIKSSECSEYLLENFGDLIIIDNWKILHGRSSVPLDASNRLVERVFLKNIK